MAARAGCSPQDAASAIQGITTARPLLAQQGRSKLDLGLRGVGRACSRPTGSRRAGPATAPQAQPVSPCRWSPLPRRQAQQQDRRGRPWQQRGRPGGPLCP